MTTTGSTIMNFADTIPIPGRNSLLWPRASALSLLGQYEITRYDHKKSLFEHIQRYRGSQEWNQVDASEYTPLINTRRYTTRTSLQGAAQGCRMAMVELICIHNARAVAQNRAVQAQQQIEKEEEEEWARAIVAIKAKQERDADEYSQSQAANRMRLWERR
ncbi:hypothetical protein BELL_0440g00010 [Botrytis elliptica]|uniref:Uncharacterized protein n=1 Tax=Botrytis elliptica TaxID=278938 RepID=A0A4Z1JFW4_9HELO|nr:hypothetical protein EAE99_006890 [Botrytis elliptica]TGO72565.1 hypothetical protein BELL_0440g00010 [Botrytis elliptica]